MTGPWNIDPDEIPADSRTRTRKRRLQAVGLGFWGLFAGSLTVLLVAGTNDLTTAETASLVGLSLGTALVAIVLGGLALLVLRYLPSIIAKILFTVAFLAVLALVLPQFVAVALAEFSVFEGVPTEAKQPLLDLLETLTEE
ncbi:hypothetical protein [Halovenus aranensis]|nr:hypothetical protein [Halovenus aranensis]